MLGRNSVFQIFRRLSTVSGSGEEAIYVAGLRRCAGRHDTMHFIIYKTMGCARSRSLKTTICKLLTSSLAREEENSEHGNHPTTLAIRLITYSLEQNGERVSLTVRHTVASVQYTLTTEYWQPIFVLSSEPYRKNIQNPQSTPGVNSLQTETYRKAMPSN